VWDVIAVTGCTKHNCILLEKCPKCKKNIKNYRDSLFYCACGYDYRQTKTRYINENEMIVVVNGSYQAEIAFSPNFITTGQRFRRSIGWKDMVNWLHLQLLNSRRAVGVFHFRNRQE
jgi:hypothetical protein